jgi:aspartate dehydrogenase
MRLALIGYGGIGSAIAGMLGSRYGPQVVVGVLTRSAKAGPWGAFASLAELLEARPNLVIECAGQDALRAYGPDVLSAGVALVPASIGALADPAFHDRLLDAAHRGRAAVIVTAGAVAGLDGLAAARLVGLDSVHYRGASPSAPDSGQAPGVIFSGSARDAALRFPTRANVTAAIALAGVGFDRTRVELVFDPALPAAQHEIDARGAFGELSVSLRGTLLPGGRAALPAVGSLVHAALRTLELTRATGAIVL